LALALDLCAFRLQRQLLIDALYELLKLAVFEALGASLLVCHAHSVTQSGQRDHL
jgi:hypothetical protein